MNTRGWKRRLSRVSPSAVALIVAAVLVAVGAVALVTRETPPPDSSGTSFTPEPAGPQRPVSLWVGDSYTEGTGASSPTDGEACLTAEKLGWTCNLDAEGGTGFVNDGHINDKSYQPAIGRLAQDRREFVTPDVVVIDLGRNDGWSPEVEQAMREYVARVDKVYPDAELVMVVPYYINATETPYGGAVAAAMRQVMAQHHGYLVDPFRSGWIGEVPDALVWTDDAHPSQAGHAYIAEHLAADLRRLGVARAVS